jgi:perosamine synthetase
VEAEKLINDKTKAIMPVHLYGQVANMDALESLLSRHDLLVIEDCAEALGSSWHGKPAGTFGDAATFSFFGNKIITTGEGGMVLFKDPNVAEHAKVLRDHGMYKNNKYWHEFVGFNYRLTNIQAAIGVAQMEQFNNIISKKRIIADAYKRDLQLISAIDCLPGDVDGSWNTFWLYTIRLKSSYSPQEVISDLLKLGIGARPIFYPLHLMPPYEKYKTSDSLEISKKISRTGISLPSSVDLDHGTVKFISKKLRGLLEK